MKGVLVIMATITKEQFEQLREDMKTTAREVVNNNGAYGKMGNIYSFILLHDDSCAIIFNPEKDKKARIGALVINKKLFMAGPTSCRMAGQYIVECLKDLSGGMEVEEEAE